MKVVNKKADERMKVNFQTMKRKMQHPMEARISQFTHQVMSLFRFFNIETNMYLLIYLLVN